MKYIFFDMVDEKVINKPMEREEVLDIFKDFSKSANELKDTYNFPPIEPPEKEKKGNDKLTVDNSEKSLLSASPFIYSQIDNLTCKKGVTSDNQ
jgi:hypothetical protein